MQKLDELYNKMIVFIGLGKTFSSYYFESDFNCLQNLLRIEIENSTDLNFKEEGQKLLNEINETFKNNCNPKEIYKIPKTGDYIFITENVNELENNISDEIAIPELLDIIKRTCSYM